MKKECLLCKLEFEPVNGNQKYCTDKCKRQKAYQCAYCNQEVVRYRTNRDVYCNMICAGLHTGRTVKRECATCDKGFTIKQSALQYGHGKYCSNKCQNIGMEKEPDLGICKQCFNPFDIRHKGAKYCSKKCSGDSIRIPIDESKLREMYIEKEFTSRQIGHIIGRSKKVVLDYLHYYGIEVRPDGIANREKIKCNDGHMVRSYYERAFDNYLYKEGIPHEHDVRLPFARRYMADFLVEDVYIEIWGMMTLKSYRERRERKIKLYEDNGCRLLEIYPEDFKDLGIKMNELKQMIS